jgi:hypothetical protein
MTTPEHPDGIGYKEVEANMSVAGGLGGFVHQPIHESLTLAALINANVGVSQDTTLDNASTHDWEYIRGAVWNDDPSCLLFEDDENNNHTYSLGAMWYYYYSNGEKEWRKPLDMDRLRNVTGRSHYGDLQFLHAMACELGEPPARTKEKVLLWLEVMYKLANGEDGITADTELSTTKLVKFCSVISLPPSFKPLRYLLSMESPFRGLDVGRRALGSMFHVIQDSYAIGHTRRTLLNPKDKASQRKKEKSQDHFG